jgi:hypothetical protein
MRALAVATFMALTLTMSACGDDDDDSSGVATTEAPAPEDSGSAGSVSIDVPEVIGESVEDATATLEDAGLTLRVVRRDGEDLAVTADFIETRVNVAVETQDDGTEVVTEVVSTG